MKRLNWKGLALIAVAGGMLAFEVVGLAGVVPTVAQAVAASTVARIERKLTPTSVRGADVAIAGRRLAWNARHASLVLVKTRDGRCVACPTAKATRIATESIVNTIIREAVL